MLNIEHLCKTYHKNQQLVIDDLSLSVLEGEFITIVGQSGCGKSTLLRIIGGFETSDSGNILLNGEIYNHPSKKMMMIFQDFHQLFPWKTLRENIRYAIKKTTKIFSREEADELIKDSLYNTGLSEYADYYPSQLSGGMKQRGALARALALKPDVLLMDEPFSSLDYFNRRKAQEMLLQLWNENKTTILLVTHDIEEALFVSEKIAVFNKNTHRIDRIIENNKQDTSIREQLENILIEHN